VGAPGLIPGGNFAPAKPGDVVTLFLNGLGATSPSFAAGELPSGAGSTVAPVAVTVAGIQLAASDVLYAGVTPFLAGLYQINIRLPANVPDGDLAVVVRVGDFTTPEGGFLTIRR
jgi:uncharacterized protein (TIGR03437 family)